MLSEEQIARDVRELVERLNRKMAEAHHRGIQVQLIPDASKPYPHFEPALSRRLGAEKNPRSL
jgi:hypothetical protein